MLDGAFALLRAIFFCKLVQPGASRCKLVQVEGGFTVRSRLRSNLKFLNWMTRVIPAANIVYPISVSRAA